jgi:4-hydroxythreonine-4-phosphate dehydrogenase
MVSDMMKVGVVTGHVPVSEVPSLITIEAIINKLKIYNKSLKQDFNTRKPKIAVLGLNPHSGDKGIIGDEEIQTISPAIEKAKEDNIMAFGPYPADGFFGSGSYDKFDGILAMYHDQGLAPFKALNCEGGVNFTAGLPAVRTSPAHGTAFEIAGENKADPASFRHALFTAIDIWKNKNFNKEISKDQMEEYDISNLQ